MKYTIEKLNIKPAPTKPQVMFDEYFLLLRNDDY